MSHTDTALNGPYDKLAEIYDRVMAHVNYKAWSDYIKILAAPDEGIVPDVLDLSCGTGRHLQYFPEEWRLYGADRSPGMIQKANQKRYKKKPAFFVQKAPELALCSASIDLVTMLYDSINYIHNKQDIIRLGAEINRILKPGGTFIFDVVTRKGLREHMDDYYETDTWDGMAYQREAWFEAMENIQYNRFTLFFNGEMYQELHRQKIRSLDEWTQLLSTSLNIEGAYADFSHKPASDDSVRIHFLCRKK